MSAQFASLGTHSNQVVQRREAKAKCSALDKGAKLGERAYPCTAALIAAVWTVGSSMLQDREVLFFCDNTAAMSAAVHGYARSPNLAPLSNALHLALASLRCTTWFEWVPSDANCADIPSRPQGQAEREFYRAQGLMCWPGGMRFPSLSDLLEPSLHDVCRAQ